IEDNDKLEFLNVQVIRSPEQQCFETKIYRKPTFTELLTNWNSYVPIQYKKAGIVSIVNRALNICSTYKLLEDEFNKIRRFGLYNNYPLSFIDTIIGIKLNQHRNKMITELDKPIIESNKKKIYVEIAFIRSSTLGLKNKIKHLNNKLRPDLEIQFFFKAPPSIQTFFQTKDPIAKLIQSDVVYYIKCNDCEHSYIGKTERQCIRRLYEHGAPTTPYQQLQQCNHESDDPNNPPELRRSSRLKRRFMKKPEIAKTWWLTDFKSDPIGS
ncbi:unnamed protein product, partial [Rotaria sordida]